MQDMTNDGNDARILLPEGSRKRLQDGSGAGRRPWHLWVVAAVLFGLYIGGARDYLLIFAGDTGYMQRQFGAGGVAYFTGYPLAGRLFWTINILAGLLAPVLLAAQSRWTLFTAVAAAAAQLVLLAVTFSLLDRWAMLGAVTSWFDIGIGIVTSLFAGYCWWLRRRGILR